MSLKSLKASFFITSVLFANIASAHFQMIIPSDDMVQQDEPRKVHLDIRFWHPFEGFGMNMAMPEQFGVMFKGNKIDLKSQLKADKQTDRRNKTFTTYTLDYDLKRPGDYVFYTEPKPYWEPTEDKYIVHCTKTVVNAFGMEEGWDAEVGMKAEIVPLTRPYGLWDGNVFQGIVKVHGKPAPFTTVEVEYYDEVGNMKAPADPMITQVVKADANGVFTYAMPWGGWWGFAALNTDDKKMMHDGKEYPVELGAVLWLFAHPKPGN